MNHAADEYDEATPGLGDEFLATVQDAFDVILSAPHRWPLVDERHHRYVVRRFCSGGLASIADALMGDPSPHIVASFPGHAQGRRR